jgi:hypothetical protein
LVAGLAIAVLSAAGQAAAASASLAGTWFLEERSSDDPVRELLGRQGGGLGSRIVRDVNIFGVPVGSLPLPGDDGEEEEELSPEQVLGALAYVFEATYRLRIAQDTAATEIRYGNTPPLSYRVPTATLQRSGWTSKAQWRGGELTIEHERAADGAHISERYWVEERADELHWTAQLKRAKRKTVDVERVFYRAPSAQDSNAPLTARLSQ